MFANPPLKPAEEASQVRDEEKHRENERSKSKWKTVDDRKAEVSPPPEKAAAEARQMTDGMDLDSDDEDVMPNDGEDLDGEDLDGEPMVDDEVVDGELMADDSREEPSQRLETGDMPTSAAEPSRREALAASIAAQLTKATSTAGGLPDATHPDASAGFVRKRQRPKAEDMFADSDGE